MKLTINEYTDTGMKRVVNEDYSGKWHNRLIGGHVFCVADGMGGYGFGDAASKIAVHSVLKDFALLRKKDISPRRLLTKMFSNVQNRLKQYKAQKKIEIYGTTLSVVLMLNENTACANIGDTRIYSSSANGLALESIDHNFVQELLHSGEITAEQAKYHPKKHLLTRALTGDGDLDESPFVRICSYSPQKSYLIATDGLYRMLNEDELAELVLAYIRGGAVEKVLQKVYDRGAVDNITFQVIRPS